MRKEEIDKLQIEMQKNLGEKWEVKPMTVKKIGGDKEAIGCRFQGDCSVGWMHTDVMVSLKEKMKWKLSVW